MNATFPDDSVDATRCLVPGCGVGERARRSWDSRRAPLPPLPAPPRRQYPHGEKRDEDDNEEPGTVTVIERDLRLLGRVIGAGVTSVGLVVAPQSGSESAIVPTGPTREFR